MDSLMQASSTLIPRDFVHKGPNQAGGKSLLSFRADIGVPGYTGHISGPHQVPLPIKCGDRLGRTVDQTVKEGATLDTLNGQKHSQYIKTFHKTLSDTQPVRKAGGGYWIPDRDNTRVKTPPFVHTTTYRAEVGDSAADTEAKLKQSEDLRCTLVPYEAARSRSHKLKSTSQRFVSPETLRPQTSTTSTGVPVGYETTNQARLSYVAAPVEWHKKRPNSVPGDPRYSVMPHAMAPGMFGTHSSYGQDYGADTSDPMERTAPAERFQTRLATTRDLAEGSTRNTNNIPGYTGHMAQSVHNKLARAQSDAPDERSNFKDNMTLFHLDQYARSRLPRYTGFRPQAPRNITLEQPSQGPPKCTTQGAANFQTTKNGVPFVDKTHHNNMKEGVLSFFRSTGVIQSDNGLFNAETYFKSTPHVDGTLRSSHLPHTTVYGKKFDNRNSLV